MRPNQEKPRSHLGRAQKGWLVKSRSILIDARAAHRLKRFNKERFAEINKEASRYDQPPRLRNQRKGAILLMAQPPRLGKAGNTLTSIPVFGPQSLQMLIWSVNQSVGYKGPYSPPWQGGVNAPKSREAAKPPWKGAEGVVGKIAKHPYRCSRSAPIEAIQ